MTRRHIIRVNAPSSGHVGRIYEGRTEKSQTSTTKTTPLYTAHPSSDDRTVKPSVPCSTTHPTVADSDRGKSTQKPSKMYTNERGRVEEFRSAYTGHPQAIRASHRSYPDTSGNMVVPDGPQIPPCFEINLQPPFLDPTQNLRHCLYGVIKIKNIPYAVTIQEIKHFLNRISHGAVVTPHVDGYPIHIIIERATGKTLECFVEFRTPSDAAYFIERADNAPNLTKHLKIGQRHVQLELSSQGELLSHLFPRAKSVQWDPATGLPSVVPNDDPHSEGFRGFFTIEEMASVVKHAQAPQRSPFSSRCLQRTYESMISTLYKFPWLASDHYTVAARDYLFTTYMAQLETLVNKVAPDETAHMHAEGQPFSANREVGLSHSLLMDFLFAGLNTPAFSMRQKFAVTANCGQIGYGFALTTHAFAWPFACLIAPPGANEFGLEFWLNILLEGHDIMSCSGIGHGFERYVQVVRDAYGFLTFTFTRTGCSLHFSEAVKIEKAIAEQFIEKGRMKWCADNNIPYIPLPPERPYAYQLDSGIEQSMGALEIGSCGLHADHCDTLEPHQGFQTFANSQYNSLKRLSSSAKPFEPQIDQVDEAVRECAKANVLTSQLLQSSTFLKKASEEFSIDPRTPEFVPSRPWTGIGTPASTLKCQSMSSSPTRTENNDSDVYVFQQNSKFNPEEPFSGFHVPPKAVNHGMNHIFEDFTGHCKDNKGAKDLANTLCNHIGRSRSFSLDSSYGSSRNIFLRPVHEIEAIDSSLSPSQSSLNHRRKTVSIAATIDEENESALDNSTNGGVGLDNNLSTSDHFFGR